MKTSISAAAFALFFAAVIPAHAEDMPIRKSYRMAAASMLPTVRTGEMLWADPLAYKTRAPQRGEVIVFRGPGDHAYIKRVIALPGETISSEAGVLTIEGETVPVTRLPDLPEYGLPDGTKPWTEDLPGGVTVTIANVRHDAPGDDFAPVTVPEGHVFVLGDNRDNSNDSRFNIGMVAHDRLLGKVTSLFVTHDLSRFGKTVE